MFFDSTRRKAVPEKAQLRTLPREPQPVEYMGCVDVKPGATLYWDIECFPNFFFVAFMCAETKRVVTFEQSPDALLDIHALHYLLWLAELVGFNTNNYDIPLISFALSKSHLRQIAELTAENLKVVSDAIIIEDLKPRDIEERYGFSIQSYNSIDLIEVAPLSASLKKYAARMHAHRLQELPYNPHEPLTAEQATHVRDYCITDLYNTALLHAELKEQLALRVALSQQYGQDLRSKSDAQIAEAIIVSEVRKMTGRYPGRAKVNEGEQFNYEVPAFVEFATPDFRTMLETVRAAVFVIDENGYPRCPQMQELTLRLGGNVYAMGLGGLHSQEKCRALVADEQFGVKDIDVKSYYPRLIINAKIRPQSMGDAFESVYESIVSRRLIAKDSGNKVEADSLKITANGTFGKLTSSYSAMYAPKSGIQVTLTGQLAILMLIEALHLAGFEVASGNTDGVVVRYERARESQLTELVSMWATHTNLETEETPYQAIYNRDVNNYIAIKPSGEVKVKGVYAEKGSTGNSRLSKNPEALILADAVIAFLTTAAPIETTIRNCRDFTRFVIVREVKGGGQHNGVYLGKVVRYYYGSGRGAIHYVGSGNKVANSDNATPCMDLPSDFPEDIDYPRYIKEAQEILIDIGHTPREGDLFESASREAGINESVDIVAII